MRRRWFVVAIIAILAVTVALVLRIMDSEYDNSHREEQGADRESEYSGIIANVGDAVCEVLVDMGSVKPSSITTQNIRIVNSGTTPLILIDNTTQCRCMWLDYERDAIAVGESVDITLNFDSRGEWGSVGNYMEITTSRDGAPIVLWIAAEVL